MTAITTADLIGLQNATFAEFRTRPKRADADDATPMFKASGLAFCPVVQLLRRAGVKPTKIETPEDEASRLARFRRGDTIEKEVVRAVDLAGLLNARHVPL